MKRIIAVILVLFCILGLIGCGNSDSGADESSSEQWDLIPMVMIDGVLYLDTGHRSNVQDRSDTMDGEITSEVKGSERPSADDQSNFGTGYGYQYGETEGTVEIYINGNWMIFATEKARKEIQFPQ